MTKLETQNRFTGTADELAKGRNKYPDDTIEAIQLAQTYRYNGRVMRIKATREIQMKTTAVKVWSKIIIPIILD